MQERNLKFENEIKIAYKKIQETSFTGIGKAIECENCLIFIAGDPSEKYYTCRTLIVYKGTEEAIWYDYLYSLKHPVELGSEIEVPQRYKYKTTL